MNQEPSREGLLATRAWVRDTLIAAHHQILADLYCPDSEHRHVALESLAAGGWDEHEYVAALVALQESRHHHG